MLAVMLNVTSMGIIDAVDVLIQIYGRDKQKDLLVSQKGRRCRNAVKRHVPMDGMGSCDLHNDQTRII